MGTAQRKMVPREHGAYAELLFPIVCVVLGGAPTSSTWLLAIAAIGAFLSNEPLLVLFGQRGTRMQRDESDRAKRVLLIFSIVALGAGIAGLSLASTQVKYATLVPLLLGVTLMMLAVQGLERSMFGEGLAAVTLSSIAIPLGLSAGLGSTVTVAVALLWLTTSLLGTAAVRLTVARTKARSQEELGRVAFKRAALVLVSSVTILLGVVGLSGSRGGLSILAAAIPVALVVLGVAALRPTARRLRLMGWSLVAANLCSLIAVVTTLKIIQDFSAVEPALPFPMF
ncbi:MAG: YwiC-like family protein [Deltaproteobacteria bacterium]|nr:YwiC-like family protein [Deltaproteobacteria bacterium]